MVMHQAWQPDITHGLRADYVPITEWILGLWRRLAWGPIRGDVSIDADLEAIQALSKLDQFRSLHVINQWRQGLRKDLVATLQRFLAFWRQLQQLLPTICGRSLAKHEAAIDESIENALHSCGTDAAVAGDLGSDLFTIMEALKYA
jgi:hypothetical protein